MVVSTRPLAEINEAAIRILVRELGPADALRFVNQFSVGQGNYTAERDELLGNMAFDAIVSEIKKVRAAKTAGDA